MGSESGPSSDPGAEREAARAATASVRIHFAGPRRAHTARRVWAGADPRARLLRFALAPAELLYRAASGAHRTLYDHEVRASARAQVPVISVGNLTVGGTGKTPFTGWLVERLRARGVQPAILHGGYAQDEPALHRWSQPDVPVHVGRDRIATAAAAVAAGARVLVLDDGFQHRRLARDLDVVLIAAEQWSERPRLLPRGGWREPPRALARAGLVVVTRKTADAGAAARVAARASAFSAAPVARAHLAPGGWQRGGSPAQAPEEECVLVTAVADWQPVAAHAGAAGARLAEALIFPDHHAFDAADLERLARMTGQRPIVTTAKDFMKLRHFPRTADVWVLGLEVRIEEGEGTIEDAITTALGTGAA